MEMGMVLTPALWALCCMIDICLVGGGAYHEPSDGTSISGLFSAPVLLIALPLAPHEPIATATCLIAAVAGCCFYLHTLFFFKALFALNDASSAETFNTLSVVLVPVLAFLLLGEVPGFYDYLAVASAALGTTVLVLGYLLHANRQAVLYSLLSVVFVSLAMVAQARALQLTHYWSALAVFSAATLLCAITSIVARKKGHHITALCRRFGPIFVVAELLQQGAVITSQRATALGPSVTLVAVAECALPLFVIVFSAVAAVGLRLRPASPTKDALSAALAMQLAGLRAKLVAVIFIAIAIVLVYRTNP